MKTIKNLPDDAFIDYNIDRQLVTIYDCVDKNVVLCFLSGKLMECWDSTLEVETHPTSGNKTWAD